MKKKLTSLLLAAALLIGAIPFPASAAELPFTDVPDGKWYTDAVSYVYENGLFGGTSATTFSPDAVMTRAMFVQVLANKTSNYNKEDWVGKSSFTDVPANAWYAPAVEWAYTYGLVNGTSDTEFSPMNSVSRQDMAVLLYRYAEKTKNDISIDPTIGSPKYPDYWLASDYAQTGINWASQRGILKGDNQNYLNPKKQASRAEVAQVYLNSDEYLVNEEIVIDEKLTEIKSYEDFKNLWVVSQDYIIIDTRYVRLKCIESVSTEELSVLLDKLNDEDLEKYSRKIFDELCASSVSDGLRAALDILIGTLSETGLLCVVRTDTYQPGNIVYERHY